MKRYFKHILLILLLSAGSYVHSQGPPNPPDNPNSGGGPVGGSAPITGGIELMLVLGLAYGSKKTWSYLKTEKEKIEE